MQHLKDSPDASFLQKTSPMLLLCWFVFTSLVFKLHFFKMEAHNSSEVVFGPYDLPFSLMKQSKCFHVAALSEHSEGGLWTDPATQKITEKTTRKRV